MVLGLTNLQRFARERTPISNLITEGRCVSRFAQPQLYATVEGPNPALCIRVWDTDPNNQVREHEIHLDFYNLDGYEVEKGTDYVNPITKTAPYQTLTYTLKLGERSGYIVLKNRFEGDETVFVSWSAQGEEGRIFSDGQGNKVRWCNGWQDDSWSYDIYKRTQRNATEADD